MRYCNLVSGQIMFWSSMMMLLSKKASMKICEVLEAPSFPEEYTKLCKKNHGMTKKMLRIY